MAPAKISSPVGEKDRQSKGKPVKNKPDDVQLVREMLAANGHPKLAVSTKVDAPFLKALEAYQKKIGYKIPDRVVDPGGTTFKSLVPKYMSTKVKEEKTFSAKELNLQTILFLNKKYPILEDDLKKVTASILKNVKPLVQGRHKLCETYIEAYQDILDTMGMKKGLLTAIAHALVVSEDKIPKSKYSTAAIVANGNLRKAYGSKDLEKIDQALRETEVALHNFFVELMRYHEDIQKGSITALAVIKYTRIVGFAVLAAVAAPYVAVAGAMTLAEAAAISTVSSTILMSAGNELEKKASGQKVTFSGSVNNVAIDGIISTLTVGIVKNIKMPFIDRMAGNLAPKIAARVPGFTPSHIEPMINNFLKTSGKATLTEAMEQALKIVGDTAKTGKAPTAAQFEGAANDVAFKLLTSQLVGKLTNFSNNWDSTHREVVRTDILRVSIAKVSNSDAIPKLLLVKIENDVLDKVTEDALKYGYDTALDGATGKESSKKLLDKAGKSLRNNRAFANMVERELYKAMKKRKVPVK